MAQLVIPLPPLPEPASAGGRRRPAARPGAALEGVDPEALAADYLNPDQGVNEVKAALEGERRGGVPAAGALVGVTAFRLGAAAPALGVEPGAQYRLAFGRQRAEPGEGIAGGRRQRAEREPGIDRFLRRPRE